MAAHLGEVDENKINDMNYIWFNTVLDALGKRLNYESISNIYGNSFAKDSAKIVQAANPLLKQSSTGGSAQTFLSLPNKLTIIESTNKEEQKIKAEQALGDISWFEEYLK